MWEDLKNEPDFWINTAIIMELSQFHYTKFLMLVCMEEAIKAKWLIQPNEQKEQIKNFIVNIVIKLGSQKIQDKNEDAILKKCNSILVQIVKFEWGSTWKSFI